MIAGNRQGRGGGLRRRRARGGRGAARALRADAPAAQRLPLAKHGADVWLKREDLSPVRSYKIRGAFNAMRKALGARPDRRRFVCASAGNHAQGMAFACRHFAADGVVFMPVTTPQQKIDKTRQFGGGRVEIRLVGDYFDETLRAAQAFAAETGALFLPPFDDPDVIEGQATCALEILEQLPAARPPGRPGRRRRLSAGPRAGRRRARARRRGPPRRAAGRAEPRGARSRRAALVTLPEVDNFVDGAAVARIGDLNFAVLGRFAPATCSSRRRTASAPPWSRC